MDDSPTLIVAHPDDEILWFTPILERAAAIFVCFLVDLEMPSLTERRRHVQKNYPLNRIHFMTLTEANVWRCSDWRHRSLTPYGVSLLDSTSPLRQNRYRKNDLILQDALHPIIESASTVVTHNPWGEYGHEEHIQLNRVVCRLALELKKAVWTWEGLDDDYLLKAGCWTRRDHYSDLRSLRKIQLKANLELYREIRHLYRSSGAWTWDFDYEPPLTNSYLEIIDRGVPKLDGLLW